MNAPLLDSAALSSSTLSHRKTTSVEWGTFRTVTLCKTQGGALVSADQVAAAARSGAKDLDLPAEKPAHHANLDQFRSTSIAGNDLLSSCLYTAGICASYAGKMAPASLALVSFMLYFFRSVYAEVVTAMPVNGGSYTALSNTTSKRLASLAACLSMISYIATAVVSAESAVNYLQLLWPLINDQAGTLAGTVAVLGIFAALNLLGISDSANVATGMFIVHFFALIILIIWSLVWGIQDGFTLFRANLDTPYPQGATWASALYFGYSSALLGITGFETAANYVEEMQDGRTYVQTLRNMWVSVAFFNPVLGLLAMTVMPMADMYNYQSNLLGPMAKIVGGEGLQTFICVDGFLVLCGSVLTAYVGIVGLIRRMAMDRCLPQFLLTTNSCRGTPHYIIIGFFGVSSSLFLALNGDVDMLGSVYNIAFLSVMTAFAISCVILKWKRPQLPRMVVSWWSTVACALVFVVAGLVGNIVRQPEVMAWFFLYFGVAAAVVFTMFNRTQLLSILLKIARSVLATGEARVKLDAETAALVRAHEDIEEQLRTGKRTREGSIVAIPLLLNGDNSGSSKPSGSSTSDKVAAAVAGRDDSQEDASGFWQPKRQRASMSAQAGASSAPLSGSLNSGAGGGYADYADDDQEEGSYGVLRSGARSSKRGWRDRVLLWLARKIDAVNASPIVFFAKTPDLVTLNKAVLYVRANEQTRRLIVVHVVDDRAAVSAAVAAEQHIAALQAGSSAGSNDTAIQRLEAAIASRLPPVSADVRLLVDNVALLDGVYPKLLIDSLLVRGSCFSPAVIRWLAGYLGIGTNMMFIAMPDARFPHHFGSLGGVRVITRASDGEQRAAHEAHQLDTLRRIAADRTALRGSEPDTPTSTPIVTGTGLGKAPAVS